MYEIILFVQLVTLKVLWSIWNLLACHRLLMFVYKNRLFVPIYSKVIPQLEMRANAQRDGRPAVYRWLPLFNAAKFG